MSVIKIKASRVYFDEAKQSELILVLQQAARFSVHSFVDLLWRGKSDTGVTENLVASDVRNEVARVLCWSHWRRWKNDVTTHECNPRIVWALGWQISSIDEE